MLKDPTFPTQIQMSFLGDSLASLSQSQESKPQRTTPAISGRKCLGLSKNAGPLGLLEKTLLESSSWAWTKYSLTWKAKATPQGRLIFQLARSAHPTLDKGSGLLHTPTATANQMCPSMIKRDKGSWGKPTIWPTPTAMTGGGGVAPSHKNGTHGWDIAAAVNDAQSPTPTRLWPTPRVSSAKGVAQSEVDKGDPKRRLEVAVQVAHPQTTGKLNPKWVAWLMGYPTEYLNSVPWETRSSRKLQRK